MAQDLYDGEFWLPSDFLTDDDLLTDFKSTPGHHLKTKEGFDFSFSLNSGLSSPGESMTETESDEDDVITVLTRKLAQSTLMDSSFHSAKGWKHPGSPQSILSGSSRGSPNYSSPREPKDSGWNLLYAAAGEVARMRLIEETTPFHPPPPPQKPASAADIYTNRAQIQARLAYLQLQAAHFQRMKEEQMLKHQFQYRKSVTPERSQGLSMAAWPTLQQSQQHRHQQSRAVFPSGKERTGTGVFLPRRIGSDPPAIPKKPTMSQEFRLPAKWSY